MLIVSKFHDYYDAITAWGIDKTVVYPRTPKLITLTRTQDETIPEGRFQDNQEQVGARFRLIGFCGAIYPCVEVTAPRYHGVAYSAPVAIEMMRRVGMRVSKERSYRGIWSTRYHLDSEAQTHEAFQIAMYEPFLAWFQKYRVPSFVVGRCLYHPEGEYPVRGLAHVWLNSPLKPYGFASVKDPVTAFQEIYMYLSGVLGAPEKETKEIDDKHKAIAHAHDGKYSFKKPPGPGGKRWR